MSGIASDTGSALRVAVLVLHYNGIDDTRRCLRSLVADGFDRKKVIVLDNGSAYDASEELRREFGDGATVIRSDLNLGYADGNNFLAHRTEADILVFLNNDTAVTPGWLHPLLAAFRDPTVAACQPKIRSIDHPEFFDYCGGCGGYLDALGFPYVRGRVFDTVERDDGQYDDIRTIDWASGAACAVRRSAFEDVGGFDGKLFAYMEEIDLSWRLRARGFSILSVPASLVYHKGAQAMRNRLAHKRFREHRNNLLILLKNLPASSAIVVLPIRLALEWCASLYYLCSGQWQYVGIPIRSFFSFLRLAPAYAARRQAHLIAPPTSVRSIVVNYFFFGRKTWSSMNAVSQAPPLR